MLPKATRSNQPVVSAVEKESVILRKGKDILEYMRQQSKTKEQRIRLRDLFSSYARLIAADLEAGKGKTISQIVAEKEEKKDPTVAEAKTKLTVQRADQDSPIVSDIDHSKTDSTETNQLAELVANSKNRVAEIKKSVNQLADNSVSLLKRKNDQGRVYLDSLLQAMKILNNPDSAKAIKLAMSNLETAYEALLQGWGSTPEDKNEINPVAIDKKNQSATGTKADGAKNEAEQNTTESEEDPLVLAGLERLLSEWGLFKSSGIFGKKPAGIKHPLYQTLKDLPMSIVLSGRFEGATSAVRQNLSDHIKGWHYEQDISYRPEETFVIYLKRIVSKIISQQKAKPSSGQDTGG